MNWGSTTNFSMPAAAIRATKVFFGEFARDDYLISTRRLPSAAEIGCYASHLMLWRRCVEMDQPIVILEDDFNLQPNFVQAHEVAEKIHR